jgi:hypothetical protein
MTHALHLTAAVTHEGQWHVTRCLQVEVTSQGKTIEDAPAPEVSDAITAPVEVLVA